MKRPQSLSEPRITLAPPETPDTVPAVPVKKKRNAMSWRIREARLRLSSRHRRRANKVPRNT